MRLVIFGATGGIGQQLVAQALAACHERLTVVPAVLSDQAAVERAFEGANAVISVLGPRANAQGKPTTRATQTILAAMQKPGGGAVRGAGETTDARPRAGVSGRKGPI